VRVRVVPPEDYVYLHGNDGLWVYGLEDNSATILIDGRLPLEVQRYTLLHELLHAMNDLIDQMLEKEPAHVQTRYTWLSQHLPADWLRGRDGGTHE